MDYKERYFELLNENRKLENELETFRFGGKGENGSVREMIYKAFHTSSNLIAICKLETGKYVDVNYAFLNTLGYQKKEVIGNTPDDMRIFTDPEESNRCSKLSPELKEIKDYPVTLKTKGGEAKSFMLSAEKVVLDNEIYLISVFSNISTSPDRTIRDSRGSILEEILNTVSSYLALFRIGENNRFYIIDLNSKVEEIEFISKEDVLGKCINDTSLNNRVKLIELLNHIRITREPHKLAVSPKGDDSEGYYMGFLLTSGNIVITWEPGSQQKNLEDLTRQGIFFEKFAEMLPEMIYEVGPTGRLLYVNRQGLDFIGYSKGDMELGIDISEIFPDNYMQMIEILKELKSPGQIASNEYLARKKDGSLVPILTHTFATFNNNKIISYRGVITDVSKQKEYENHIKREKAFLEHLYDSIPAAISITSSSGKISMINREFSNLFGYTSEEAIDNYINDLIVPDDLQEEAKEIDDLVSANQKEVRQTIRKDINGNKIYVSLVATEIVINNEVVAHLGIFRDITIEKKNQILQEILFNISTAALKQYDLKDIYPIIVEELKKIWDTNNFFIAIYDEKSEKLTLPFFADENDNFYEIPTRKTITGWVIKQNKSVLLKENDLKILEDEGVIDLVGTPCKIWMGVPLTVEKNTIGVMCLQDYNDENKFSLEDLNILEFIANQIAIAIQRRMILDSLIQARKKAEEAAQAKQLFMSTMSHEIRTPLNEVIGITNLLLQGNPREDQMDYIKTLKFSGNHLLTLVNDVLDYNKMESGKIIFEQTQFNLSNFLDEIMRSYLFRAKAKNITFDIIKGNNLPVEIIGDPIRLNQILSNLLSNALKFTIKGSITVTIREVSKTENQSRIEFIVADTGIGIPKEKHSSIFDRFTQASSDTTRNFGGTGLGLAICKKLVELQGGTITLESEPDKGSTFRFEIPVGILEKGTKKQPVEVPENFAGLEGKKVLVAEDNKINFFVANKFLISWGIIVTHAENGQVALNILEKNEFDLVLMDLHMPVLDGIEATRIIRNSENTKIRNIPIVALTAAIMSESHDKIDELKINDYVLKPFKPYDLFQRILKNVL